MDQFNSLKSLAEQLGQLIKEKKLVLVTAESCTGGWVSQAVTEIPGSSDWFDRGFVTYSDKSKQEMLDVPAKLIADHGAVSEEVVRAMAEGALNHSDANVSVAITGIAGPSGAVPGKPIGTCWFAWGSPNFETISKHQLFDGDRTQIRQQAVVFALSQLKQILDN